MMSAKSILAFRQRMPVLSGVRVDVTRRATEAELEYVRARAREAARADFAAEQRLEGRAVDEEPSCE
jgi:hypothetical protein